MVIWLYFRQVYDLFNFKTTISKSNVEKNFSFLNKKMKLTKSVSNTNIYL